jgi:purine-binding chemotaxis protein CheW
VETPASADARPEATPTPTAEVVIVRLGGCRYALPMPAVAEVGRPPSLTRVPGVPAWVAGVANWRGRVLAVLDLRPLLSAETTQLDRRGRLVVLTRNGVTAGLLTEGVEGTADVDGDSIEPSLANLPTMTGASSPARSPTRAGRSAYSILKRCSTWPTP